VVIPSLPGYGFSDRPSERGMNPFRIADLWAELMTGLGYQRFGAQGGDWGSSVASRLGSAHLDAVIGIHLNYIPGSYAPYVGPGARELSAAEQAFQQERERWAQTEGGYGQIQRTKPLIHEGWSEVVHCRLTKNPTDSSVGFRVLMP
jgi:pimeloyl-ACP methyl ester carboxylesterase